MTELYQKYIDCGYRVTTDSRKIEGGEIFFALRGENFDGNLYAAQALKDGARWAVVNKDVDVPSELEDRLIRVDDPFSTLQQLAIHHRLTAMNGKRVLGLTGTNGKTTTKELIAAVLSRKFKVTATQGNLNNDIGVPLSLLKITPETEIAVIEMGANHPDDIAKLVKVSQPDCGLITNVGRAHLLGFGSFEGVKAAKGELYKYLSSKDGSLVFINNDDEDLLSMAREWVHSHIWPYGLNYEGAQILPSSPEQPFLRIQLKDAVLNTQLVGSYNAPNVMAALAVGQYFGVDRKDAIAAIEEYCPSNNRSQMTRTERNTLIIDAYNANPSSMKAALENFSSMQAPCKLALLGDMRELGEESLSEHKKIVDFVVSHKIPAVFVGEEFKKALGSSCDDYSCFGDSEQAREYVAGLDLKGSLVLVKGSRGIKMENILPVL